ncbi:hypothetical protein SAICODRAFT_23828 [Saitoella complicata NRRL Y-17804]|nr:uncharacterized protein SAICODRAFT_23828 [Saitoella complicata NRRL Y-17804]ODQ55162.1 hypothetical protein SAICODRAFT_23828 [Saitoella complicata NRRL Y-17804]
MAGLAANVLGWAVTGFAVRAWQLGLRERPYIGRTSPHPQSYSNAFAHSNPFTRDRWDNANGIGARTGDLKTMKHHFSYMALFGVAGYFIYGFEQSQYETVERRRDQLLEARRNRGLVTEEA